MTDSDLKEIVEMKATASSVKMLEMSIEETVIMRQEEPIEKLVRQARKQKRLVHRVNILWGMMIFSGILLTFDILKPVGSKEYITRKIFLLCFFMFQLLYSYMRSNFKTSVQELMKAGDLNAVGPLIEMIAERTDPRFPQQTLIEMLPRMQASDSCLLSAEHRRILNRILQQNVRYPSGLNANLRIAILKSYEQIGDSAAVPFVERLAKGEGYAKKDKLLQKAAQECLPFLYERSENETQRQTLLRASQPVTAAPDTLLRPVSTTMETDTRQLLRPAASEIGQD